MCFETFLAWPVTHVTQINNCCYFFYLFLILIVVFSFEEKLKYNLHPKPVKLLHWRPQRADRQRSSSYNRAPMLRLHKRPIYSEERRRGARLGDILQPSRPDTRHTHVSSQCCSCTSGQASVGTHTLHKSKAYLSFGVFLWICSLSKTTRNIHITANLTEHKYCSNNCTKFAFFSTKKKSWKWKLIWIRF